MEAKEPFVAPFCSTVTRFIIHRVHLVCPGIRTVSQVMHRLCRKSALISLYLVFSDSGSDSGFCAAAFASEVFLEA